MKGQVHRFPSLDDEFIRRSMLFSILSLVFAAAQVVVPFLVELSFNGRPAGSQIVCKQRQLAGNQICGKNNGLKNVSKNAKGTSSSTPSDSEGRIGGKADAISGSVTIVVAEAKEEVVANPRQADPRRDAVAIRLKDEDQRFEGKNDGSLETTAQEEAIQEEAGSTEEDALLQQEEASLESTGSTDSESGVLGSSSDVDPSGGSEEAPQEPDTFIVEVNVQQEATCIVGNDDT